ncbi:MAG TPA: OsmC family peroxiredoxin, partial [Thermoanaerobaculia bacterium]
MKEHDYHAHLIWDGNRGDGTSTYEGYGRDYRVAIEGKPDIEGSANATFHGDRRKHDPEDLFVAAIASGHMRAS